MEQWFRSPGTAVLASGASDWVFERSGDEPFGPPSPGPLGHLVDCVRSGRPPMATIRDARESFRIALAAYASARDGCPVRLPG